MFHFLKIKHATSLSVLNSCWCNYLLYRKWMPELQSIDLILFPSSIKTEAQDQWTPGKMCSGWFPLFPKCLRMLELQPQGHLHGLILVFILLDFAKRCFCMLVKVSDHSFWKRFGQTKFNNGFFFFLFFFGWVMLVALYHMVIFCTVNNGFKRMKKAICKIDLIFELWWSCTRCLLEQVPENVQNVKGSGPVIIIFFYSCCKCSMFIKYLWIF